MIVIAWVILALVLAYPWLRESWIMATVMTLAWFFLSAPLVTPGGPVIFLIGAALIWTLFILWRLSAHPQQPAFRSETTVALRLAR